MRQAYECRTQQEIVSIKHSDIIWYHAAWKSSKQANV